MLCSTMPDELRAEKGYYAVGGCGGNIAWHTENDTIEIADKDILLRDMKVYLASVLGVANAEIMPFDWRATAKEFSGSLAKYEKAAAGHLRPRGRPQGPRRVRGGARELLFEDRRQVGQRFLGQRRDHGPGAHPRATQLHRRGPLPA